MHDKDPVPEIRRQHGRICQLEVKGLLVRTLKVDWTAHTNKLGAMVVLGEIGKAKQRLHESGVRFLQIPNNAGTYNVFDWETGEKRSISDRAPFYFE